ncbi:23S rRNA (adenine(2030)-N(6))-methyltransferase RlmJ [Vreelandella massiliensis]|uniref:23S rRNA (adenine(2030)-N(6))-methyltransferase RlmJ n=1 Tax=Vreelandella massiliensis TaxID=1816686 RepID=UPI00096A6A8B|nr:23S rRNA (adenine(2030)-N(6))-methyltransferase RlmJ [Halomonas massiliensis]
MLSYQHAYHAGNFADVHKHLTLFAVVDYLLRKKSPVTYIDTHAGRGVYPLAAKESQRLQEHREGVEPLWHAKRTLNTPLLRQWCDALASLQPSPALLTHYPGSPWWLHQRLREQDALQLFELHPGEHRYLEDQVLSASATRTYGDGLAGLTQRLPVATPRLCVLIDPSYERKEEYHEVKDAVAQAMKKARHAIVMIWYPLLPAGHHHTLIEGLAASGIRNIWRSELCLRSPGDQRHGMYGSGMLVINPPWGLDERLAAAMREVVPLLGAATHYHGEWLVGE